MVDCIVSEVFELVLMLEEESNLFDSVLGCCDTPFQRGDEDIYMHFCATCAVTPKLGIRSPLSMTHTF